MSRVILHCDMNNFYASVECLKNPDLRDKKVAVCGSVEERRGIVLAKNEKAKKAGIKTGDTVYQSLLRCKDLVIIPPHFEWYNYYSKKAYEIYCRYTDLIEPFGMDECWLDVTASTKLFGSGEEIAEQIRETIKSELGLTVSVGVSFNKVFAKLGSDLKKPDAVTVLSEENYKERIYKLPVDSIIGIGKSTTETMRRIGIDTIGELAVLPCNIVKSKLGKHGEEIWKYVNGLDNSPVMHKDYRPPVKSIGRGTTTAADLTNKEQVHPVLLTLSRQVARCLRREKLIASGVQITVKDNTLVSHDYQCKLTTESDNSHIIFQCAFDLFNKRYKWEKNIRALTVRAINLEPYDNARQMYMTCDNDTVEKWEKIENTEDIITARFGKGTVKPMSLIEKNK